MTKMPHELPGVSVSDLNDMLPLGHACGAPSIYAQVQVGQVPSINRDLLDQIFTFTISSYANEDMRRGVDVNDTPETLRQRLWETLINEFRLLVCTDDEKYETLRDRIKKNAGESALIIVSTISSAMAPYLGFFAGVLVPFCSILLMGMLELGIGVFCKFLQEEAAHY